MSYNATVLEDNPAVYWRLNESVGTMADSSGNGIVGTVDPSVSRCSTPVITEDCAIFMSTAANAVTSAGIDLTASDWAMEAWVFIAQRPESGTLYTVWAGAPAAVGCYGFHINSPGHIIVFLQGVGNATQGTIAVSAMVKTHIVIDFVDATSTLTYYLNGTQLNSPVFATAPTPGVPTTQLSTSENENFGFLGTIDEAALYLHTLGLARVQAHYEAGFVTPAFSGDNAPAQLLGRGAGW